MTEEPLATDEVADALDALLNADLDLYEDHDHDYRSTDAGDLTKATQDPPEDTNRFSIKKKWKSWKKKAKRSWKKAKKAAEKKWRAIRRGRDWKKLRGISWGKASKAWGRMKRAARKSGKWMRKNLSKRKLRELSKKIRRAARRNRKWFEQRTKFLPKPVRWYARKWYKFSSYSLDGISIRYRIYNQIKDGYNIAANWWNPCGWASMYT